MFTVLRYHLYRLDRVGCRGGGICDYVKDCLLSSVLLTPVIIKVFVSNMKFLWLNICECVVNYTVGTLSKNTLLDLHTTLTRF